jgi:hypothetical protein
MLVHFGHVRPGWYRLGEVGTAYDELGEVRPC